MWRLSADSDKETLFLLLVLVAHTLKSLRKARIDRIGTTDFSVRRTLIGEKDAAAFEDRARLN